MLSALLIISIVSWTFSVRLNLLSISYRMQPSLAIVPQQDITHIQTHHTQTHKHAHT